VSPLNENQARGVRVSCQYIDRLLGEIETILNSAGSSAAFPQYIPDISPEGRGAIEEFVKRIRVQLRRILEGQGVEPPEPSIPAARAVRASLFTIDIVAEELKPSYMKGFGEMDTKTAAELNGIAAELRSLVARALGTDLTGPASPETSGSDAAGSGRNPQTGIE